MSFRNIIWLMGDKVSFFFPSSFYDLNEEPININRKNRNKNKTPLQAPQKSTQSSSFGFNNAVLKFQSLLHYLLLTHNFQKSKNLWTKYIHVKICVQIFIDTLFIMRPKLNQANLWRQKAHQWLPGAGSRKMEVTAKRVSSWGEEMVLKNVVLMVVQIHEQTKNQ